MHKTTIWMAIGLALLVSDSRGDIAHKRLPFGFQGMRGKKSVALTALDENFDQGELDRAPYPSIPNFEDLTRFTSIHDPWLLARVQDDLYERPNQLSSFKRAPMGFLGMRGKKNLLDGGPLYQNGLDEYAVPEYTEKRGLKGFQGMRGKKQYEYLKSKYFNKRRTMGFQGMRGKKDNIGEEPMNYYGDDSVNDLQNYLIDSGLPYQSYAPDNEFFEGDKRGLKGFQGMRGKREFESGMEENKRAPSGFMGMRGKKEDPNEEHAKLDAAKDVSIKPTSQSSENTVGMQEVVSLGILPPTNSNEQISSLDNFGVSDQDISNNLSGAISIKERRSPNYGFYGVRGKKGPSMSSFYGVRGKKAPYGFPFRGKFVGVRGKKSDNLQHLDDRMSFDADSFQKRRGPSGFVGMRGKKSITPDDEYDMMDDAEE